MLQILTSLITDERKSLVFLCVRNIKYYIILCLVDDLMEPFRPIIDCIVWHICQKGEELDKEAKGLLAGFAVMDIESERGVSPFSSAVSRMTGSLTKVFLEEEKNFFIPQMPSPDALRSFVDS